MYLLKKQLANSQFKIIMAILVANIYFSAFAHDTKVTHPVLTLEAIRLLEKQDKMKGEFAELYRTREDGNILENGQFPLFWGAWNTTSDSTWLETAVNKRIYPNMDAADIDETEGFWHDLVTTPYAALHEINDINYVGHPSLYKPTHFN